MTLTATRENVKAEYERQRILGSATKVSLDRGFNGAMMDHIAREMRVTKGFIYYYKSKGDVFYELHVRAMDEVHNYVNQKISQNAPVFVKLEKASAAHFELLTESSVFGGVAASTAPNITRASFSAKFRKRLLEQREQFFKIYDAIIEEGVQQELFSAERGKVAMRLVIGALTWGPVWYCKGGSFGPSEISALSVRSFSGPELMLGIQGLGVRIVGAKS